jgi:hypothetical protein
MIVCSSSWSDDLTEFGVHQAALVTDLALCINRYRLYSPGWYVGVLAKLPGELVHTSAIERRQANR